MAEKEKESMSIEEHKPQEGEPAVHALPEPGTAERMLAERKLVRKLDSRMLPTIFVIFIMNYIDVGHLICSGYYIDERVTFW